VVIKAVASHEDGEVGEITLKEAEEKISVSYYTKTKRG